jgi:hypothetical protein
MTRDADFKAIVRARAQRQGVPYTQARRDEAGRGRRIVPSTLHVTNGDSAAGTIREIGLGGQVLSWRDVLHEGPVPAGSPDELRAARARFLAGWAGTSVDEARHELEQRDAQLIGNHERYVLWFEADLYDQLQLIQVLDALAAADVAPGRVELVSAGEFPGVAHFGGLGELPADALAGLHAQRVTLGPEAVALARQAWAAFRASDPGGLAALAAVRSRELRFLGEAIARLLQEYPWTGDGLSLTERRILQAIGEERSTAVELFRRVQARESRPYLGDTVLFDYLRALADCAHPLVEIDGDAPTFGNRSVALTEIGRRAVAGSVDHLALNEPARWIGGVHLTGREGWRYDPRLETLIREPPRAES